MKDPEKKASAMPHPVRKLDSAPRKLNRKKYLRIAARNTHTTEDAVFRARVKFERWVESVSGLYELNARNLIAPPDGSEEEGFEADEFTLVPTRDLDNAYLLFEEARELLDHKEKQFKEAYEARQEQVLPQIRTTAERR